MLGVEKFKRNRAHLSQRTSQEKELPLLCQSRKHVLQGLVRRQLRLLCQKLQRIPILCRVAGALAQR